MTKTIVNLLNSTIASEIEDVLSHYADHPYQQAFAIPELRQELIAYVLSRAPSHYVVMDESMAVMGTRQVFQPIAVNRQNLREWIHEGIAYLLNRDAETISQHIPDLDDPRLTPSHWFG